MKRLERRFFERMPMHGLRFRQECKVHFESPLRTLSGLTRLWYHGIGHRAGIPEVSYEGTGQARSALHRLTFGACYNLRRTWARKAQSWARRESLIQIPPSFSHVFTFSNLFPLGRVIVTLLHPSLCRPFPFHFPFSVSLFLFSLLLLLLLPALLCC